MTQYSNQRKVTEGCNTCLIRDISEPIRVEKKTLGPIPSGFRENVNPYDLNRFITVSNTIRLLKTELNLNSRRIR